MILESGRFGVFVFGGIVIVVDDDGKLCLVTLWADDRIHSVSESDRRRLARGLSKAKREAMGL